MRDAIGVIDLAHPDDEFFLAARHLEGHLIDTGLAARRTENEHRLIANAIDGKPTNANILWAARGGREIVDLTVIGPTNDNCPVATAALQRD